LPDPDAIFEFKARAFFKPGPLLHKTEIKW
jgi:hypothetical protein